MLLTPTLSLSSKVIMPQAALYSNTGNGKKQLGPGHLCNAPKHPKAAQREGLLSPSQSVWPLPEAWRAKLGSCLLTGMLGSEARLARFLRMTPMFLRGLFSPVGTDMVPLPRRGRRPVEAEKVPGWSWSCLSSAPVTSFVRMGAWEVVGKPSLAQGLAKKSLQPEGILPQAPSTFLHQGSPGGQALGGKLPLPLQLLCPLEQLHLLRLPQPHLLLGRLGDGDLDLAEGQGKFY